MSRNGKPCQLSRTQGFQLVCLWVLVRDGKVALSGDQADDARALLKDVGEELALQIGGVL